MWQTWKRRDNITNFWLENLPSRDHVEELGTSGIILKCIIKQQGRRVCNGFICLNNSNLWLVVGECGMNLS
jgi:hypothetical protein